MRSAVRHVCFTLIELLVVIAIIAVLASILLPALDRAKESVLRVQCLNQTKQMALGALVYAEDHDSFLPLRNSSVPQIWTDQAGAIGLFGLTGLGYIGSSAKILLCPSRSKTSRTADNRYATMPTQNWNSGYSCYNFPGGSGTFVDSDDDHSRPWFYWVKTVTLDNTIPVISDVVVFPEPTVNFPWLQQTNHCRGIMDGGNATFTDGHGEWIRYGTNRWRTRSDAVHEIRWPDGTPTICYYNTRTSWQPSHAYFFADGGVTVPRRGKTYRTP
jgi:prepilin-type N-terminal cleavage/methylation domain-containing protein